MILKLILRINSYAVRERNKVGIIKNIVLPQILQSKFLKEKITPFLLSLDKKNLLLIKHSVFPPRRLV